MKTQLVIITLLTVGAAMAQRENEEQRKPPTSADFIKRLDKDSDGKVSKSEFDGPAEHFAQLDKNSDGYIGKNEAPSGPPPKEQKDQRPQRGEAPAEEPDGGFVKHLDKDGDGKVSKSEFDGPSKHFSELDKNNDGYLSEDEAPAGPPPGGRK